MKSDDAILRILCSMLYKAFDDWESKQINMVYSIHKFKYMFSLGIGGRSTLKGWHSQG